MPEPGRRELALAAWESLKSATWPMRVRLAGRFEGDAPTPAQMSVLRTLLSGEEDARTPLIVARCLRVTPATVSSTLNALEAAGLIERVRKSGDRRVVNLRVTAKGRERVARWRAVFLEELEEYLSGVTLEELRTLRAILSKLERPASAEPAPRRGARTRR